jgi:glycogen operon protein
MDYTGTGNSLNVGHPHTLQLIMDSLRYWVTEMHVDGFRFDLASTLAREFYDVDKLSAFFELVQQDPTVSQVKLIAEPWDVGPGGYQVGNFPPQWTEWNGKYRDTVRDYWRGEAATLDEFAYRRPRRVHAEGPGVLQRKTQRRQRGRQPRRREPQPIVELRGRRPDRRSRD